MRPGCPCEPEDTGSSSDVGEQRWMVIGQFAADLNWL